MLQYATVGNQTSAVNSDQPFTKRNKVRMNVI